VDLVPEPLLLRISGSAGNRTRDFWISSLKLLPLDHRGDMLVTCTEDIWGSGSVDPHGLTSELYESRQLHAPASLLSRREYFLAIG
jgi:hypothetical protein